MGINDVLLSDLTGGLQKPVELASKAGPGTVDPYQPGDGVLYGDEYTPILTAGTNCTAAKLKASKLLVSRFGPNVLVSGTVQAGSVLALLTETKFYMSLPIPSDLGFTMDLGGAGTRDAVTLTALSPVIIKGDVSGNRAEFKFNSNSVGLLDITFTFQYGII